MTDNGTATPDSINWDFPTLAFVWDYRNRAIIAGAERLESLAEADRVRSLTVLSHRVATLAGALDDGWLVATAFYMVEDLYKSCYTEFRWSPGVPAYLAATAGVVMQELDRRGFVLHYVIDNVRSAADLDVWLDVISAVFEAAGLLVTGPQLMALELMQRLDGRPRDVAAIPAYRTEGHDVADRLIERCHRERRSSVYLNLDLDDDTPGLSLDVALSQGNTQGTIVVFRNAAATAGSMANICPPPGVALPAPGSP